MDYIVSAEDTPYYHWQLELLLQSFRRHGLQDHLLVALASRDVPRDPDFTRNLRQHRRFFTHDNVGRLRGYPHLNKAYAVSTAVAQGRIAQPFTVIEPDMLLYRPPPLHPEPITFQIKNTFTLEAAAEHLPRIRRYILEATVGHSDQLWLPLGSVYSFHDVPDDLFSRAVAWAEFLAFEESMNRQATGLEVGHWKYTERAGWGLAFLNYYGMLAYRGTHDLEMTLLDMVPHAFIHYTNGLPPTFSKYLFKYEPPIYLAGAAHPYDAMLREAPSAAAVYAHDIIKEYLG